MKQNKITELSLKMSQTEKLMPEEKYVIQDSCLITEIKLINDLEECDRDGRTLLISAALYERSGIVLYLISQGASVNARDKKGFTALHAAIQNDDTTSAKILLDSGANVNAKNTFGNTPLMMCKPNTSELMLKLLLDYGADPTMKNNYNVSALNLFAAYPEIIALLQSSSSQSKPS